MGKSPKAKSSHTAPPKAAKQRSIVLFSDGTGNSSAKLQKTNVWRLYEALDLGYPAAHRGSDKIVGSDNVQIAYYDDGVGTSAFKLLAILGGVFGFGLARNIRDIYKFLCRNYRDDDPIFAFGFSRGAYTIRLLVGMIAQQGIARYHNEQDLDFDARDIWSEYRRNLHTNNRVSDFFVSAARAVRRMVIRAKRTIMKQRPYAAGLNEIRRQKNTIPPPAFWREWRNHWFLTAETRAAIKPADLGPKIAFVGVWDTVAAYGGPFIEITRALDEWVWPLTMSNYRLSARVQQARHALAIDDKRDAFLPLLWDETAESDSDAKHPRLQQVWFAGMHSDVGGGYADESLSFVSLHWMIEHAEQEGLRVLPEYRKRIETFRNIYGPIHNSRGGGGAFYRYQPRYINAWVGFGPEKQAPPATQIFRDPTIDRGWYKTRGLLNHPIRLHKSVVERLRESTDGYGPNNLPEQFLTDDGIRGAAETENDRTVERERLRELGDRIKLRRFWYFASLFVLLCIISKPWWGLLPSWLVERIIGQSDARTDAQPIEAAVNALLPDFAQSWTASFAADPLVFLVMVLALMGTMALGLGHEKAMVDQSRQFWKFRFGTGDAPPAYQTGNPLSWAMHTMARFVAKTGWLQWMLAAAKWRLIPWLVGLVLFALVGMLALAGAAQFDLFLREDGKDLCAPRGPLLNNAESYLVDLELDNPCQDMGIDVKVGQAYFVKLTTKDWKDGGKDASPAGWENSGELAWWMILSKPYRRVIGAPLFAPLFATQIVRNESPGMGDTDLYIFRPKFRNIGSGPNDTTLWEAEFELPKGKDGRLHFFINDAYLMVDPGGKKCKGGNYGMTWGDFRGRYRNNCATIATLEFWPNGHPEIEAPQPDETASASQRK